MKNQEEKCFPEIMLAIISHAKLSRRAFGISIGHTSGTMIDNVINGRNGISAGLARKITNRYPEISYEWILTGKGTMLVKPKETPVDSLLLKRVEVLERISEGQDARIKLQSLEINAQASRIENLETLFDTKKNLMPRSI